MSCFWGTMHDKQNKIMDDERITCVVVRFFVAICSEEAAGGRFYVLK